MNPTDITYLKYTCQLDIYNIITLGRLVLALFSLSRVPEDSYQITNFLVLGLIRPGFEPHWPNISEVDALTTHLLSISERLFNMPCLIFFFLILITRSQGVCIKRLFTIYKIKYNEMCKWEWFGIETMSLIINGPLFLLVAC